MKNTPAGAVDRRGRRAVGLAGLLAAVGLAVAAKEHAATPGRAVTLQVPSAAPRARRSADVAAAAPSGRFVGAVEDTRFGPVQVAVHLTRGRITDVAALQLPAGAARSRQIAAYAAPLLRQEILAAQSARIDAVSGASYTSDGYAQSVQSALDGAAR